MATYSSILAWRSPWTEEPGRLHAVQRFSCSVVSEYLQPHGLYLPGSSIHGISQARILEWVAISFSRGSFLPRDWTSVSCIAGRFFTYWATRKYNQWDYKKLDMTEHVHMRAHTHTHTLKECLLWCGICLRHQGESATPICLDFLSKNQKQGTLWRRNLCEWPSWRELEKIHFIHIAIIVPAACKFLEQPRICSGQNGPNPAWRSSKL